MPIRPGASLVLIIIKVVPIVLLLLIVATVIDYDLLPVIVLLVMAWVAVVFGINCASNVGKKLVGSLALLLFPAYIMRAINSKLWQTMHYKLIQYIHLELSLLS